MLFAVVAGMAGVSFSYAAPRSTTMDALPAPFFITHRGDMNVYPEHTMEAYRASVADGAYFVEVDCHRLPDGTLVVMHDTTLDRTTNRTGAVSAIANLTAWRQVRVDGSKLSPSFPGKLFNAPTLEDVLAEFANKVVLVVEAKGDDTGGPIVDALRRYGVRADMVLVNSFRAGDLEAARAAGYKTCLNFSTSPTASQLASFGYSYIALNSGFDESAIREVVAKGIKVIIYTVNRQEERDRLLRLGVAGFYSDNSLYLEGIGKTPVARTTDPYAGQTWYHGQLPANGGRMGFFSLPNLWGYADYVSDQYSGCLQGWCSPLNGGNGSATFELKASVTFGSAMGDDRWAGVLLTTTDHLVGNALAPANPLFGLHFQITKGGRLMLYRYSGGNPSLVQSVETGSAIATGETVRVRLTRQGGRIRFGREGMASSVEFDESTDRGTYLTFGARGAHVMFSNVLISSVVSVGPVLIHQVASQYVSVGGSVSLSVNASGPAPISFQWRRDGVLISGATSDTLLISSAKGSDAGLYTVEAANSLGSTTSTGIQLTVAPVVFAEASGVAVDSSSRVYVADAISHTVTRVIGEDAVSFAGSMKEAGATNGVGETARFNQPKGLAVAASGLLYVADAGNGMLRTVSAEGIVATLAGSATLRGNVDGSGTTATFSSPTAVSLDSAGYLWVADASSHTVRRITPAGVVETFAGNGGSRGDRDGDRLAARFNSPAGIAVGRGGEVFVADTGNHTIRKISASGTVSTFAGLSGVVGYSDGRGDAALFNRPTGIVVESSGALIVADSGNSTIRRIGVDGTTTTIAGIATVSGLRDGVGGTALFNRPEGVALLNDGQIIVADAANGVLRRISTAQIVTTWSVSKAGTAQIPATPTTSQPSASSAATSNSGGGGGGGAPSWWFLAVMTTVTILRGTKWARRSS